MTRRPHSPQFQLDDPPPSAHPEVPTRPGQGQGAQVEAPAASQHTVSSDPDDTTILRVTVTTSPSPGQLADWARLVVGVPGGDVAQLPGWARLRATVGFTARYVLVHEARTGRLLGGAQVLERAIPLVGRLGYLPRGPVLAHDQTEAAARAALCAALTELSQCLLRALFVQPPAGGEAVSDELLRRGFRPSQANIAPGQTLRLDLRRDLAELRGGLSRRLRTWTNRWAARGVSVRVGTAADVPLLAHLVARSGEHQGFGAVSNQYLRTLFDCLGGGAERPDGHVVLFVGELSGRPVAAALYTRCADTLTLRFAGMDRDEAGRRLNAPAAVQWEAIEWAKRAGVRWFDFGGISADTATALTAGTRRDKLRGVDRFKASFGGELVTYPPAVELISNPLLRVGYDILRHWAPGRRLIELARAILRTGRH